MLINISVNVCVIFLKRTSFILLILFIATNGCKGGKIITYGIIQGPNTMNENSFAEYSIDVKEATGSSFMWYAVPDNSGIFTNTDKAKTIFYASKTDEDVYVTINVLISSDQQGYVIKTISVLITNRHGLVHILPGVDNVRIAIDTEGNILATGSFSGYVDLDPGPGKDIHNSNGQWDIYLSKYDKTGEYIWGKTWGGSNSDGSTAISVDDFGNIYLTGYFEGISDFDPGPGIDQHVASGYGDAFISKFTPDGSYVWGINFGSDALGGADFGWSLAIDKQGYIYNSGEFLGPTDFDPSASVDIHINKGKVDTYLAKYDQYGSLLWVVTWGGYDTWCYFGRVATDGYGSVYVGGVFQGTVEFDPAGQTNIFKSEGASDVYVSKFSLAGDYEWSVNFGGQGDETLEGIVCDSRDGLYLSGWFYDYLNFDTGLSIVTLNAQGDPDSYLCRFDQEGRFSWVKSWGGIYGKTISSAVADDLIEGIMVAGSFQGTVDFNPAQAIGEHTAVGTYDSFLCKYDYDGNLMWERVWGGVDSSCTASWVAIDFAGNSYIAGWFYGLIDFDPGTGVDNQKGDLGSATYVSMFPPDGNW